MSVTIATPTEKFSSSFTGVSHDLTKTPVRKAEQRCSGIASTRILTMSSSALVFTRTDRRREMPTATG